MKISVVLLFYFFSRMAFSDISITDNGKALLSIVNLSIKTTRNYWKPMYSIEEDQAASTIKKMTENRYQEKILLTKTRASYAGFLENLEKLLNNSNIKIIDIILYVHGFRESSPFGAAVEFVDQDPIKVTLIAEDIQKIPGYEENKHKLRMLYSDACWGNQHLSQWLSAGFKVVNGATAYDVNWSVDVKAFLTKWFDGQTYLAAMTFANKFNKDYLFPKSMEAGSHKDILGDGSISY